MTQEKRPAGRPRIIADPDTFDALVDFYVQTCRDEREPVTLSGMILALGLSSRESLDEYRKYDGFSDCVKRAKMLVAGQYERNLHGPSAAGSIFALKNMGWSDRSEHELSGPSGGPMEVAVTRRIVTASKASAADDDSD